MFKLIQPGCPQQALSDTHMLYKMYSIEYARLLYIYVTYLYTFSFQIKQVYLIVDSFSVHTYTDSCLEKNEMVIDFQEIVLTVESKQLYSCESIL